MHMSATRSKFVDWEEHLVSHDRGSRVVHYYLKDRSGLATLAVVGTERSLRHMVYVISDDFLPVAGLDKTACQSIKWRSRREVVDWLSSFLANPRNDHRRLSESPKLESCNGSDSYITSTGEDTDFLDGSSQDEGPNQRRSHVVKKHRATLVENTVWVGDAWSCRKRFHHYPAFQRNGVTISLHNFVYVMLEGNSRHIAYIEDMYEDRKSKKKLRVIWFHTSEDLAVPVPPPVPHPKEVFMTPFSQVLSVECVDGMATVLTPEHYERLMLMFPDALPQTHVCFRQFDKEGIKPMNICNVKGYWHQKRLASINLSPSPRGCFPNLDPKGDSMEMDEDEEADMVSVIKRGRRTARRSRKRLSVVSWMQGGSPTSTNSACQSVDMLAINEGSNSVCRSFSGENQSPFCSKAMLGKNGALAEQSYPAFDVGDKVELLCEDSGIRGCWYQCTVLRRACHHLKVCYDDLEANDGNGKLEEWVPSAKVAFPDGLGIRMPGRCTIRPSSRSTIQGNYGVGSVVDAWWNDGWWEGVVLYKNEVEFLVYFPDEKDIAAFKSSELRCSKEWYNGQWVDINSSEVMKSISSMLETTSMFPQGYTACLQQNISPYCSLAKSPSVVNLYPELLERFLLRADISDKCGSPKIGDENIRVLGETVPMFSDGKQSITSIPDANVCTGVETREFCEVKMPSVESKEESVLAKKVNIVSASPPAAEEKQSPLNGSSDEVELKWRLSKKRHRQANSSKSKKSSFALAGVGIGETSENMLDKLGWSGNDVLPGFYGYKEKGKHDKISSDEESTKVKKMRAVHDNLMPLRQSTNSNLFMSSVPLVGLVMSR